MASLQEIEIKKIEEMRNSGLYPIVNLEIFDTVMNLKLTDYTLEHEEEIINKYREYLENIFSMKKSQQESYLKGIKIQEIMDTQLLEQEDSYLLALYMQTKRESAMDFLLKAQKYPLNALTKDEIIVSHKKLLEGTSKKEYAKKDYRDDNLAYVVKSGKEFKIHYFALNYQDIEEGLMNLVLYYNGNFHEQYTLVKPCLIHGLTGALQMFSDGNTRLGRMLQNVKIYELTDQNLKFNLSNPALYSSRSYKDYREQYRNKLGDVAITPNNDTWNAWLNFNLNRMEDQIYYMNNKLKQYKKL